MQAQLETIKATMDAKVCIENDEVCIQMMNLVFQMRKIVLKLMN